MIENGAQIVTEKMPDHPDLTAEHRTIGERPAIAHQQIIRGVVNKHSQMLCRRLILTFVCATSATLIGYGLWKVHPWMPTDTAVFLGRWHFKNHEFEVWQRKQSITEPFATGLFVRDTNGGWHAFCLNIDDFYAPKINLIPGNSSVAVVRRGKVVGNYDIQQETFRMTKHHENMVPERIQESPPGKWFKDAL